MFPKYTNIYTAQYLIFFQNNSAEETGRVGCGRSTYLVQQLPVVYLPFDMNYVKRTEIYPMYYKMID